MLKAESADRFRIDFSQVRRTTGWRALFSREPVVVDGLAIGKVLVAAINACPMRTATGAPQVWNEFRLFLARQDHDRLRPLEQALHRDLMPMLYEEMLRINAASIGGVIVRLLVDDAEDVAPGSGILHVRYSPDAVAAGNTVAGEITVRMDRGGPNRGTSPPAEPLPTSRVGGADAILRTPEMDFLLSAGVRYTVGRAHPEADPTLHIGIPGASSRINRRQLSVLVEGDEVEITREPGESNPVRVGGTPLPAGQSIVERLPIDVTLSGGEMVIELVLPEPA